MMKRNWWKRASAIGLAVCLTAGLCACGKGGKNENAALAKEGVYKVEEFALPEVGGDDFSVLAASYQEGMLYLMMQVYHWTEEGGENDIRLLSMKGDGTDINLIPLEIPEWQPQANSGSAASITPREPEVEEPESETDPEGEVEPETEGEVEPEGEPESDGEGEIEGEAEPEIDSGFSVYSVPDVAGEDIWENSSYYNYVIGADGRIHAIRRYYYENYSSEIYIEKDYIVSWNMDGSYQGETELENLRTEDEYSYINSMTVAADGTVTLLLSGDNAYKMIVDAQGNVAEKIPMSEEMISIFRNYDRIVDKGDGTYLVIYYDEDDWTKEYMATYDPVTDTLGQPTQMPANFGYNGYSTLNAGISSDLIGVNDQGIFTYKAGDEAFTQKMNFVNSDLNLSYFSSLIELDETSFIGVYYESYEEGLKAGVFTYVDPKDIPDKSVLVLAGNYIGSDMERRVIEFNRNSDKYRIVVKSYDSYNSYDDWQAGFTQLNNDVTTGNMPDILITDGLPVENYIAKGLLADIGKLIEEDEELSKVEFVQNVFDAFSVDGKLYYVIPTFNVRTMIGKTSVVGDRTSWTMSDMKQLQESLPEGTNMMGEMTRSNFFMTMMDFCGSDFFDVGTGKCDFDSQNFIDMMEYAKSLPEELGEDYYGEDYWMNYESQYREERTILSGLGIGNIRDINYNVNGYFGEEVSYIGFPTEKGMGSYLSANNSYAISAKCNYTEGAWEFLRYYLTDEYQSQYNWGLPIQMKYFNEKAKEALERPYYMDEEGNKVEYDDYFYMNGEEIVLSPLTQDQVDKVVSFILSVDKCYYYNENIINIINEEMDAYFTGQKTAQEVAKIIQNRAQIYVDENR